MGCGTGTLAIEFASGLPGVRVVGLDLSEVALQLARNNLRGTPVASRVTFEHGDAADMPFGDGTFDLVISSNTLHLTEDPVRMLNEVDRVLKPEGRIFMSDLRRSWLGIFSVHLRASYSPAEVRCLLSESKLRNWRVKDYFFWLSILSEE